MELTDEQIEFLKAEGKVVLCAVPGSGKTFIVARKLLKYLDEWKYAHRGVAVLSFTNVASDEIQHQATEISPSFYGIRHPHFVGTLDSFINNYILLRFGYLMQKNNRKRPVIVHENYGELSFYAHNSECYKRRCTQNPYWFRWSSNGWLKNNKPIDCDVNPKPCIAYKQSLIKNGIVIQSEVPALSLLLLKKYPKIADELAYRFPVIIVDEAQDTSHEQIEILDILAKSGLQTIILVGDPDQAIYEWRNATPEYFINKIGAPDWKDMYLTANFRSSQSICNATRLFSNILKSKKAAEAKGENAAFPCKPILLQISKGKTRMDIVNTFKKLCKEQKIELTSKNVAVLTRGRIHSDTDIDNIWKTPETQSFAMATYYWYCSNREEAYRLCEKALFNIEIGSVNSLSQTEIRQKAEECKSLAEWNSSIISILKCLPSPDSTLRAWKEQLICAIESLINTGAIKVRDGRKVTDIIKIKRNDKRHPQFLDKALIDYFEKRKASDVTYSSVHGVKGKTFDATLLIVDSTKGANSLTPTVLNTGALNSELIRIAYVAMTRPRKLLAVSVPESAKTSRFPSEYWDYREM